MAKYFLPLLFLFFAWTSHAQEETAPADSLLLQSDPVLAELDSLLNSSDSLSVLGLIDSLLSMEPLRSQVALRLGYSSNVNAAARSLSINKFGLSPGVSYYHKSGAYADASAYWSQEYDPSVYLAVASAGYLGAFTPHWTVLGEYSRYFYFYKTPVADTGTPSTSLTPYTNNIQVSNFWDAHIFTFRFDYSFLFGERNAHRLSPVIGLNLRKKNWLGMDRISFFPSVSLLSGNETIVTYVPYTTRILEIIYRYRRNLPLTYPSESKEWGVMNYGLSAPLSASLKGWTFLITYNYNIPQALPGEELGLTNSGFLSLSISRYIDFHR